MRPCGQLLELSELSRGVVLTEQIGHPVLHLGITMMIPPQCDTFRKSFKITYDAMILPYSYHHETRHETLIHATPAFAANHKMFGLKSNGSLQKSNCVIRLQSKISEKEKTEKYIIEMITETDGNIRSNSADEGHLQDVEPVRQTDGQIP